MRRHIKYNNLIYSTGLIEFRRYMAAIAIKDKEVVGSLYIRLCTLIKILNPFIS
jgi:hypothetical protein